MTKGPQRQPPLVGDTVTDRGQAYRCIDVEAWPLADGRGRIGDSSPPG